MGNLKVTKGGDTMLDVKALKAKMVLCGYTNETLSKELGMSKKTLNARFKSGDFGTKEIEILIKKLHIENPMEIFFAGV